MQILFLSFHSAWYSLDGRNIQTLRFRASSYSWRLNNHHRLKNSNKLFSQIWDWPGAHHGKEYICLVNIEARAKGWQRRGDVIEKLYSHFVFVGHTGHVDLQLLSSHWIDRAQISEKIGHQHQVFLINRTTHRITLSDKICTSLNFPSRFLVSSIMF